MARLGLFVLVASLAGCVGSDASDPLAWDGVGAFIGDWQNVDPNTRGTLRIEISTDDEAIILNPWGACSPTPCNNGPIRLEPTEAADGALSYTKHYGFKIESGHLSRDGDFLVKTQSSRFTDASGREDYTSTDRFARG